jgi:A/G-specific adenine glycosylase
MLGFPGDGWDGAGGSAPLEADWQRVGEVRHTFTHFHLVLQVLLAEVAGDALPQRGAFLPPAAFRPSALPTVMRKAHDLAASAISPR